MNSTSSSNPAKSFLELLNNIWGYVTVVLTLVLAVLGLMGSYPITTAILTVFVLSVFFCSWRWSQITKIEQSKGKIVIPPYVEPPKHPKDSLWNKILDINRKSSNQPYSIPVTRRRIETGIIVFAILLVIAFTFDQYRGAFVELGGLGCPRAQPDSIRIVVANFDNPDSKNNYFETRLGEKLSEQILESNVCRWDEIIEGSPTEIDFGGFHPSVVVKGGTSNGVLHITINVLEWFEQSGEMSISMEDIKEFENVGIDQIPYLSSYVVSESLFIDGQEEEARERLQAALDDAERRAWVENSPESLANGYLLLGDINTDISSEADFNPDDLHLAVDNYTRALELNPDLDIALFNRGFAYNQLGEYEKAFEDYTQLLEKESPLSDTASADVAAIHTNLGWAKLDQGDYSGAIEHFLIVIEHTKNPEDDPYIYFDLGVAYLWAGEFASAQKTFEESIPYLDADIRDDFILGLKEEYEVADQVLKDEISVIVRILENADI